MAGRLLVASVLASALVVGAPVMAQEAPTPDHRLVLLAPDPPIAAALDAANSGGGLPAEPEDLRIDCRRDLPCRLRLRGVLGGNNGGIALEGTAFTW